MNSATAQSALTEAAPERAGTEQDQHSKLMMPNGITKPCDGELIAEQKDLGAQITESQKDQQNREPSGWDSTASPS